jgi:multidrug resistance efflux pump
MGRYTAEVVPVDQVPIVPEAAGQVIQFDLEVGDLVSQGDLLLSIDSSTYEAQRAQALAALQAAQAQLDLLLDGAKEQDIEAARAAVTAADEAYKRALEGPTEEDLIMAEAQLRQAEAAVKRAQAAYDQVSWNPLIAALPESVQLESATLQLESAQAQYEKLTKGSTEDVIAGAYAQLASARAQLQALEEGAKPAQVDAAQAQVNQAETALYLSQLQLDKTQVRAPINGIVASVSTSLGSMVAPGNPVAVIMSPDVEIVVPVEETRLAELAIGQPASIRVDAFPDREFAGEVAIIAPTLDPGTRTVQVTIRALDGDGVLRPGMFATVELIRP